MFEFIRKAKADAARLTAFHRRLTAGVGVVGGLLGIAALIPYMSWTREALGLPMGAAPLEGIRLQFGLWILALLIGIPILFYVSTVLIAGLLGGFLLALGRMTRNEAIAYMFYSRYPNNWFTK